MSSAKSVVTSRGKYLVEIHQSQESCDLQGRPLGQNPTVLQGSLYLKRSALKNIYAEIYFLMNAPKTLFLDRKRDFGSESLFFRKKTCICFEMFANHANNLGMI